MGRNKTMLATRGGLWACLLLVAAVLGTTSPAIAQNNNYGLWGLPIEWRRFDSQGIERERVLTWSVPAVEACRVTFANGSYMALGIGEVNGLWQFFVRATSPDLAAVNGLRLPWNREGTMARFDLPDGGFVWCGEPGSYGEGERLMVSEGEILAWGLVVGVLLWRLASWTFRRWAWEF